MISANNVTYRVGKKALFEEVNIKFTEGNLPEIYDAMSELVSNTIDREEKNFFNFK